MWCVTQFLSPIFLSYLCKCQENTHKILNSAGFSTFKLCPSTRTHSSNLEGMENVGIAWKINNIKVIHYMSVKMLFTNTSKNYI